jgi:hypothetical protein
MKNPPIHVCWIDRITRDLKLPNQSTTEIPNLESNSNFEGDQQKRKCFDTFQSLKVKNIPEASSLYQE